MSKRLQVLLDERELRELQQIARRRRMTVAEWVRQTLRSAARREPEGGLERKLDALSASSRHRFPAPDIDRMLEEIERGYTEAREE